MTKLIIILLSAVFINNYVLSRFLGICPFLGVSKKLDSATGDLADPDLSARPERAGLSADDRLYSRHRRAGSAR